MLSQRILTALLLIPLVIAAVLLLPTWALGLLLGAVVLAGGYEWTKMVAIGTTGGRWLFLLLLGLTLAGLGLALRQLPHFALPLSLAAVGWWVLVTLALILARPRWIREPNRRSRVLFAFFVLPPAWAATLAIHATATDGPLLLLFLLLLIWVADSAAYFTGRRWGRRKLAPSISPGKSREGVYGALVGAALCGVGLAWYRPDIGSLSWLVPLCVLVALLSVVGDLFESLLKRQAGLKDSGQLLPGHGGVLDRIDSLTAAAPLFSLGLLLLERA